ncbi:MAG: pyridoxal-phosphate dependent enzyme [Flavisolibacter sp.]|nr:pyridoxal-phosphate dependent enzyme [Flavisolibacter sp.]
MNELSIGQPRIETIEISTAKVFEIEMATLRLDVIHPVVSGNKWYKLREYLNDARSKNKKAIVTFGGAYSNHVISTAAACQIFKFQSIGIIRGEKPVHLSPTLSEAQQMGMRLFFVGRTDFRMRQLPQDIFTQFSANDLYFINEGGYGIKGKEGAQTIITENDVKKYTHICAAVGTGTMLAGLIQAAAPHQQAVGISVLKNNFSIEQEIEQLLPQKSINYHIFYDYHFGGYAKYNTELLRFMNNWYGQTGIPSDFVYTGKMFYGVNHLLQKQFFKAGSKVLVIHSGGLQGNRSLTKGTLIF